jgi:hypothetical protein
MQFKEQELEALEKQLKALYLSIADKYKQKSKVNDNIRLDGIQAVIDSILKDELVLRGKIDALRKEIMNAWQSTYRRPTHTHGTPTETD